MCRHDYRFIFCPLAAVTFLGLCLVASPALAEDFSGGYTSPQLKIQIIPGDGGTYSGTITLGEQRFPIVSRVVDGKLQGTFSSQGSDFSFSAALDGNHLTLVTGSTTYRLERQPPRAANPLDAAPPANPSATRLPRGNPAAPASGNGELPEGYMVVASVGDGRALFVQKADATTPQAAIAAVRADMGRFFDARPAVSGAFADAVGNRSGGAMFTASLAGRAVKGSILCGIGDKGAAVTILYDRADAPAAEWSSLVAALPTHVKTREFAFPDGSGSVRLPEGWNTNNQSVVGGVTIDGPASQRVSIGQGIEVLTPDAPLIVLNNQLAAQARQLGGPPPPPITLPVAPYTGPVEALKNLVPQISEFSRRNGGPEITLEKILDASPAAASVPNGKAALISYTWIKSQNGEDVHFHSLAQIECYAIGNGAWGVFFSELAAPEASFAQDLPAMWAIAHSFKVNDQVVAAVTQNIIQRNNQQLAAFQQANKEKNESFDRFEQSMKNREVAQERSNADFDEVIRGYRTVEDTQTGQRTSVDLGNSDEVVNALNQSDPGRYKQIPLRDEEAPQQ